MAITGLKKTIKKWIILKVYSKWRYTYSRRSDLNICKTRDRLWHLSQDLFPLSWTHQDSSSTLDICSKEMALPPSPTRSLELVSSWERKTVISSPFLQLRSREALSQTSMSGKSEFPSLPSPPLLGYKNARLSCIHPYSHIRWKPHLWRHKARQSRQQTQPNKSLRELECHSEGNGLLFSPPGPVQQQRNSAQGERQTTRKTDLHSSI